MSSYESSDDSFDNIADPSGLNQIPMELDQTSDEGSDEDSDESSTVGSWSTVDSSDENSDEQSEEDSDELSDENDEASSEDRAQWLNAIKSYAEETQANSLDLGHREMKHEEVVLLLQSLTKSKVLEIDLSGNNFKNQVQHFSKLLAQTRLKKLNFTDCKLTSDDLLHLMAAVKDSEIIGLNLASNNFNFDESLTSEFVELLCQSRLTHLNIMENVISEAGVTLAQSLPKTSLTHLDLRSLKMSGKCITLLISNLPHSAVMDLNLWENCINLDQLKQLSEVLKDSKLKRLNLSKNNVCDAGVNALTEGLVHSKITKLSLRDNRIKGQNNLGQHLKYTRIKTLDLSCNKIECEEMFDFPNFLKGSFINVLNFDMCKLSDAIGKKLIESLKGTEVTELNVVFSGFGSGFISEFCKSIKHTNLTEIDFTASDFPHHAIADIGSCLKESKLKSVGLYGTFTQADSHTWAKFIEKTKGSPLLFLDISENNVDFERSVAQSLENTTFTHINLMGCEFSSEGFTIFAATLKSTAITHLILRICKIGDDGMEILAKCLKGTQLVSLDVSYNSISTRGAKALADVLKDTNLMFLTLLNNKIGCKGFYYLAEQISSSFVTVVEASTKISSRKSLIVLEKALWENRKIVQQLIDSFKRIVPEANNNNFRFDFTDSSPDSSSLLDDCLVLYNTVVKRPSAVNVLAQEKSFSLSKSQITTLMLDEFPTQFALFIARSVEADVSQHVEFLKRTEELGLSSITECLLLNRPLFIIDEDQDILHPFVYKLMHKYKQPIVNSSVEPDAKGKLIEYFTNHEELEGATDVINLLRQNVSTATPKSQNS